MSDSSFMKLSRRVLQAFPQQSIEGFQDCFARTLLLHFTESFTTAAFPHFDDLAATLNQYRNTIHRSLQALEALNPFAAMVEGPQDRLRVGSTPQQWPESVQALPPHLFEDCVARVPASLHEIQKLGARMLRELKSILKVRKTVFENNIFILRCVQKSLFSVLRERRLAETFKNNYLFSVTSEVAENHGSASDTSSSFAQMSAKKTSLLAQYTEDFGERRILASSRLIRNLKQARNKHPKLFDRIVVKLGWARK